ncbi:MAG: glutamate synthase subunit beta [Planctomycetes bacterium]|nr:glutamate synthase subunit beta [Planctomycetota bacterium]
MAKPTGFIEYPRQEAGHRPVQERVKDYFEIDIPLPDDVLIRQAARCMDCGVPFCHGAGCPLGNRIPEFNDLVYRGKWKEAAENLHSTNNFPEITGRVCPALCEASCTLNINDDPVLIRHIECQIAERAFSEGWVVAVQPSHKSGRKIAIVGSGPAGLAAAQQLARAGHDVTVFEKDERVGGLLRLGIPDFKLDKRIIDRRIGQLQAEGVRFETGVNVGADLSPVYLRKRFDAVLLAMGAGQPRDLPVAGRELENVLYAVEYLTGQNLVNAGREPGMIGGFVSAKDRIVVVIGGGDTGSDCVGTARRQGAKEIHQFEILPQPPDARRNPETPWPNWPRILRTSSSHEEGCVRKWCILTKKLSGRVNRVEELHGCQVEWRQTAKGFAPVELPGTDFSMKVDLVLIAMGFVHVAHPGLVEQLGLKLDQRGNISVSDFQTSEEGIFASGDTVEGASLVVRAINSGRQAAKAIDEWLKNK